MLRGAQIVLRLSLRAGSTAAAANAPPVDDVTSAHALSAAKPYHEIPGPKAFPVVGNTWRFIKGMGNYASLDFVQLQKQLREEYGDIVRLSGMHGRCDQVFLFNPESVEKVLRNDGRFPYRDGPGSMHYYRTVLRKDRFKGVAGTITTQGEEWQKFRTKVNQPLMHPRSALRYLGNINDVADEFLDKIRTLLDHNKELPHDFMKEFHKWSVESIAAVALDTRLGCLAADLRPGSDPQRLMDAAHTVFECFVLLDFTPSLWRYVSTPAWRRFVRAMDTFTDIAEKYIQIATQRIKQRSSDGEGSILERLLIAEGPEVANLMATDMLFGGVDTTSNLAASLLFYIATYPIPQEKLAKELEMALPNPREPISAHVLEGVPYLKACIKESLRILPIVFGNVRRTQTEMVVDGYRVPKNVDMLLQHMLISHDERHFPRPLSFEPERWLRGGAHAHTAHPFASLPFGFGPRTCVGRRFAEMEVQVLLAKMVRNFKIEYHYGDKLQYQTTILNNVTSPLKFRLLPRRK
ncbi:hypothetical protein R5R35_011524 [Gryllus longicercus]|uniref:Cytochrome P450 n=1 Tax=Gryllus longicercus TaxID=2509291 RepID=A0AAN9VEB7_9ORTH